MSAEPVSGPHPGVEAAPAVETPPRPAAPLDAEDGDRRRQVLHGHSPGEAIQEIVEYVPGGLLRWGIATLAAILSIVVAVAWLVSYPDVVRGRFNVTTVTPPARMVARISGEIARIAVEEGQRVSRGDLLLVFESPTPHRDALRALAVLDALDRALGEGRSLPTIEDLALGDLQGDYARLLQASSDFLALEAESRFYDDQRSVLRTQLQQHREMAARQASQQELLEVDLGLARREVDRRRRLREEGVVAVTDFEAAEKELLQVQLAAETGRAAVSRSRIEVSELHKAVLEIDRRQGDERRSRTIELRNAVQGLRTAIAGWEDEHVVRAPLGGTVSFFRDLHEAQHVVAGEPIVAVLPESFEVVAKVQLDQRMAGKVEPNQRVILRFDSYPFRQYGTVTGVVQQISGLTMTVDGDRHVYLLDVRLPEGLRSSYDVELDFRQELRGDADIVTAERRLLQRLFDQFRIVE